MFNGIWPKPTNKLFNSAYLQIKYLISRKIHSNTRQNFYLFITSHHDVSEKKIFQKQKNQSEIFPAKPAEQKKQVAPKNSLRLHTRGTPAAASERVN